MRKKKPQPVAISHAVLSRAMLMHWRVHPIEFIETVLFDPDTGQPFRLLAAERTFLEHAFTIGPDGRLLYDEWLYSCPKKSGKTTFEALIELTMTLLYGGGHPESFILANSQEQGRGRVFEICCRIINASPLLKGEAAITADKISFPAFNATIFVVPCDAGSAAGTNAVCAGFDGLWAYTSEAARRLWDEMTPPPTRKIACRVTVTYAGFEGESILLEELYHRGLQQPLIGPDLYAGNGLLMFWSHKPVAPWQDAAWLARMRRERASAYQRQVLNQFASSASQFIDMALWRDCVDPNAKPFLKDPNLWVMVGVDASTKRDSTALCAVAHDSRTGKVRIVTHRIFQPSTKDPLDFAATVEATLLDWRQRFALRAVYYDPYQMAAVAQRMQRAGVRMVEFPQTPANLTAIGSNLFELIRARAIDAYPDNDISAALSHAIVKEGARGLQITKEKSAHRIDVVIALAMAAYACVQCGHVEEVPIVGPLLFSLETGADIIGPQTGPAAPGLHRPMTAEPWYPYLCGHAGGFPGGPTLGRPPGSGRREW